MSSTDRHLTIQSPEDVDRAKMIVGTSALEVGFDSSVHAEMVIVTSELASNLLRHAGSGTMTISILTHPVKGLSITTLDSGPGIADLEMVTANGFSTTTSFGNGLGTVNRLMDSLTIHSPVSQDRGTKIECCKYLRHKESAPTRVPVNIWVATKPHPAELKNGDGFITCHDDRNVLAGVIDGLGHGESAHQVTQKVRRYVEKHAHLSIPQIFLGAGRSCLNTRGAVMSLVRIEWQTDQLHLSYGAVGNIETRIYGDTSETFPIRRGILGRHHPIEPSYRERTLNSNETLVMFSDGVNSQWDDTANELVHSVKSQHDTKVIYNRLAKHTDDATLLIIKPHC